MIDTLPDVWVGRHARRTPDATAIVRAGRTVSYAELDRLVEGAVDRLRDGGVSPRDVVPVAAALDVETIVSLLALPRLGAVVAPYGHRRPDTLGEAGASAYAVVPTSGSGGDPRATVLTGENVSAAVVSSQRRLGNDRSDRWMLTLPLFHVGGIAVVWRSVAAGGSVELLPRFDAATAVAAMRSDSVTMASLVPTMLHRILELGPGPIPGLRAVLIGGAPASRELIERALAAELPVLQTYGMTETCSQVATVEIGAGRESLGTVGRPLDGFRITFDGGEILIDGPAVSPGYLGEPARIGPLRTGDLGHLDADGRLVVTGRAKDVIITGGENVHASRVEQAIERLGLTGLSVVVGVDDAAWGQVVVAVVEGTEASTAVIERGLEGRLAPHEMPKRWIWVEALPLLPNGKPDRDAVRVLVGSAASTADDRRARPSRRPGPTSD